MTPALSIFQQVRGMGSNPQKSKSKGKGKGKHAAPPKTSRRGPLEFRQKNLKDMEQYTLCDAMR
jgi:large subunit ribosomal protein L1